MTGKIPSQPAIVAQALRVATALLALILVMKVSILFATNNYDWDLDHEMYFGQRLLNGDLIWTEEFHDKLPFVQVLFAAPAWFKSIQIWRLMSFISCFVAAFSISYLVPRIFNFLGMTKSDRNSLLTFTSTLYLTICVSTSVGLTHINPMATSFALMATLLMMYSLTSASLSRNTVVVVILMGGFFAAAAISIRPYFIAPLVLTVVLGTFYPLLSGHSINSRHLRVVLCWGGAVVTWGITLNLLPYLLTGHIDIFVAGLQILQQKLNGRLFSSEIGNTYFKLTCLLLTAIGALLAFGYRSGSRAASFLLFIIVSAAVLFAYTIQKHWWGHYIQLFFGYFSLAILFLVAWVFEGKLRFRLLVSSIVFSFLTILTYGLVQSTARDVFNKFVQTSNSTHRVANIFASFQAYRSEEGRSELTFLAPHSMYLHWQLDEPRHGFPHAANTGHIFNGWWQNIAPSPLFRTPRNKVEYCHLLSASGPEIIVAISNSPVTACFQAKVTPYKINAEYPIDGMSESLVIFRRK